MVDKPDIVKKLMEEEKLGMLNSRLQVFHEELEVSKELPEESFEDVSEGTVDFVEYDAEKKERISDTTDYEQTAGELQDNEMYRTIFENVNDEIIYVDKHGKILYVNKRSYDIFGYKPEEIIGKNFIKLGWFGVKDLPKMFRLFKGAIKGRTIDMMELEVKHKAGHIVPVEVSTRPVKKNGKTAGFLSIVRDITERKHAEKALQDSKKRFEELSNLTLEGILIHDKGVVTDVNESLMRILGYKREELIGKNIVELCVPQEYHATIEENLVKRRAEPYEVMVKRKDETLLSVELEARNIKNEDGEVRVVAVRDITKWKKAEEKLKESEKKFRSLFDTSRDAIMTLAPPDWKFTSANPATVKLFNAKDESEFTSKGPWDVSPEKRPNGKSSSDEAKKMIGNAMETGSSFFGWVHQTLDGKDFPATVLLTRVEIEEGKPFLQATVRDVTKQKKTEEQLRESEGRFKDISQNIGDWIWEVDKDGKYIFTSGNVRELLGYETSEILGKTYFNLMPEDEARGVNNILKEIVSEKKPIVDLEKWTVTKDGRKICLLSNGIPLLTESGKLIGYRGVDKDITKRKQIENEMRIRGEAISSSMNAIVIADMDGRITYTNRSFLNMWKYNNEHEVLGEFIIKFMEKKGTYMRIVDVVLDEEGWIGELSAERKDGLTFSVQLSMSLIRNDEGKPFRLVASFVDITRQKEAEKSLKENEEKFRTFMETAHDLMSITDKDGNFTYINKAMTMILEYSREEMIGMHITQILTKESLGNDFKPNWEKLITNGEIGIETVFATKSGNNMYGELKAVAIYDGDNKYAGARVVIHDITTRRNAEKKIMESQKKIKEQNVKLKKLDELKSTFLNVTSHELRTPMSSIKGYVQLLIKQSLGNISKEQEKALKVVLRNTDRLDHLIQDILDISRLESGTMKFIPEKTDLQKMMNEVAETMKSSAEFKEITVNVDIEGALPELEIDQDRIKQVIINFINNAIKFSPDGAIINLRAKKEENNVFFEVQDFGRGIQKDQHEKVFEIFYQVDSGMDRKFGGAGLGLAISRGIVLAHGGNIWVESKGKPGEGSSFKFALPIKSVKDVEDRFKKVDVFKIGRE